MGLLYPKNMKVALELGSEKKLKEFGRRQNEPGLP